jgi:hypothetical protein
VLAGTVASGPPCVKARYFWYNTWVAPSNRTQPLRLESRSGRITAIDAAGFLAGAVVLAALRFVPQLVSPLAFWLLLAALAAAFGVDLFLWHSRGIHAIELDGDTLAIHRGGRRSVRQLIERTSVCGVRVRRSWGGQSVEIRLRRDGDRGFARRTSRRFPPLTRKGRVLLREDAFDRKAFAGLAERLAAWKG